MPPRTTSLEPLPIDAVLPRIIESLRASRSLVLRAPTGAGKTTRVAPALLDCGVTDGSVILVEPRRLAARAAAGRIAFERGQNVGGEVGYQVRFDSKTSSATRLVAMTEGLLVRRLQDDPFLEGVGAVLFDEFHERNLDADLGLAMVRMIQRDLREDITIVVMSATLVTAPLATYLGDCPVIESQGRLHPVAIEHRGLERDARLEVSVVRGVRDVLGETGGDVLVFLPGVGEIRRCATALEWLARAGDVEIVELYGDLAADRQDAAIGGGPRRRIVLATNVAESSVTVDGVTAVVDSGLARVLRYDASVGLDRLELGRIGRASADQRAGRAGRTAPGLCLRLWSKHEDAALREGEEPEIRRVGLARAVLELRAWGERSIRDFPWFEPPEASALERAEALLSMLGAVDESGITELGRAMARLPVSPRIARMLVEGARLGNARGAATAAALLSERDPFRPVRDQGSGRSAWPADSASAWESDVLARMVLLVRHHSGPARFIIRVRDQLLRSIGSGQASRAGTHSHEAVSAADGEEAVLRAILCAFPDRVARRRDRTGHRAVMVGGRGVRLVEESCVATAELFVCVDLDAGRRGERAEALVRQASAIERDWLPAREIRSEASIVFDEQRSCVTGIERTLYRDLVLEERRAAVEDDVEAARVLAHAAAGELERALALADAEVCGLRARVAFLGEHMPELALPILDDDTLREMLPDLCAGRRSFDDLRRAPLLDFLRARLDYEQQQALDRHAPERIEVPSGSGVRLLYEAGRPPVLAARIQELFGLAETPRVAGGRVGVLVHLLAPNRRPQQITDDLASFWNGAYQEVRRELRRRYPRHSWPEDPWNAPAQRRPSSSRRLK